MRTKFYPWSFALFSAHIRHFFPHIRWEEHEQLYQQFKQHHGPRVRPVATIDSATSVCLRALAPSLLCLYHLGNHYECAKALAGIGLRFDLLLDREVYRQHEESLLALRQQLGQQDEDYCFLFSDDPKVLLQVRRTLRAGKHLVVFADGNSGTKSGTKDMRTPVRFFEGQLSVKYGIALISYLLEAEVLPLFLSETQQEAKCCIGRTIDPKRYKTRGDYLAYCMQSLYDALAEHMADAPWLWECWGYIHGNGSFDPVTCVSSGKPEALLPVSLGGQPAFFDRENYVLIR